MGAWTVSEPPQTSRSVVRLGAMAHWAASFRSYGTAKSGVGISAMAVLRPDLMMKNVVPVIMAGIIAVSPTPRPIPLLFAKAKSARLADLRPRRLGAHLL